LNTFLTFVSYARLSSNKSIKIEYFTALGYSWMILFKKSQSSSLNEDSIFKIFTMTFLKLDCFFFLKSNTINMEAEAKRSNNRMCGK